VFDFTQHGPKETHLPELLRCAAGEHHQVRLLWSHHPVLLRAARPARQELRDRSVQINQETGLPPLCFWEPIATSLNLLFSKEE
jgi:hypothetical protein